VRWYHYTYQNKRLLNGLDLLKNSTGRLYQAFEIRGHHGGSFSNQFLCHHFARSATSYLDAKATRGHKVWQKFDEAQVQRNSKTGQSKRGANGYCVVHPLNASLFLVVNFTGIHFTGIPRMD